MFLPVMFVTIHLWDCNSANELISVQSACLLLSLLSPALFTFLYPASQTNFHCLKLWGEKLFWHVGHLYSEPKVFQASNTEERNSSRLCCYEKPLHRFTAAGRKEQFSFYGICFLFHSESSSYGVTVGRPRNQSCTLPPLKGYFISHRWRRLLLSFCLITMNVKLVSLWSLTLRKNSLKENI